MFPYKSAVGLLITKKMKALALIKVEAIYAVSCHTRVESVGYACIYKALFVTASP